MDESTIRNIRDLKQELFESCQHLLQENLQSEAQFISFARDRGIPVRGIIKGDPGMMVENGVLTCDAVRTDGERLFHPFRIYPLIALLNTQARYQCQIADRVNAVADLAVLLEPIYWPRIINRYRWTNNLEREELYSETLQKFVRTLDPDEWKTIHEKIRLESALLDSNRDLYILLRVSPWEKRKSTKGALGGALWMRHLAEVIRRAFEAAFEQEWCEEDRAFGIWTKEGRKITYGSERPLDDTQAAKPYLAHLFGLHTGSTVRWYVEGDTEFGALTYLCPNFASLGVEIVNLKGQIGKGNHALSLTEMLEEDLRLRRFSMLTFDRDDGRNPAVKAVKHLVTLDKIVGSVCLNDPDFEFANFSINELVEVAGSIAREEQLDSAPILTADWRQIDNAKQFEKQYRMLLKGGRPLKSERFGTELGKWAERFPVHPETKEERPIIREVRAAEWAWNTKYDLERERFRINPDTFSRERRA